MKDYIQSKLRGKSLWAAICVLCVLIAVINVIVTLAYMKDKTEPVNNIFAAGTVKCSVVEQLNGDNTAKTAIQVRNDGTSAVYVRVKLVTYWVNAQNEVVGKPSATLSINLSDGWIDDGNNVYYCKSPVESGELSPNLLSADLAMTSDSGGARQVIEVISEAIQITPEEAVESAWGVNVVDGKITGGAGQ